MIIDDHSCEDTLYERLKMSGVTGHILGVQFIGDQDVRVLTTHGVYIFDTMQFPTTIQSQQRFSVPRRWLLTIWFWLRTEWELRRIMN